VHLQHQEERGYYRPKEGKSAACLWVISQLISVAAKKLKDRIKADHTKAKSDYHMVKNDLVVQFGEAILGDDAFMTVKAGDDNSKVKVAEVAGTKGMYCDVNWNPHGVSTSSRQESDTISDVGGINWRRNTAAGAGFSGELLVSGIGPSTQFELTRTISLAKTLTTDEVNHKSWDLRASVEPLVDLSAQQAGSILAYSWTTFYLAQSTDAFDHFFKTVVDPVWLEETNNVVAEELRDARSTGQTGAWRIFHRVTERVRQKGAIRNEPADNHDPVKKDPLPVGVDAASNAELVRYLLPLINFTELLPINEPSQLVGAIAGPLREVFPMLEYASNDGLVMALANLLMAYVVGH
jgi:hypothetical protein